MPWPRAGRGPSAAAALATLDAIRAPSSRAWWFTECGRASLGRHRELALLARGSPQPGHRAARTPGCTARSRVRPPAPLPRGPGPRATARGSPTVRASSSSRTSMGAGSASGASPIGASSRAPSTEGAAYSCASSQVICRTLAPKHAGCSRSSRMAASPALGALADLGWRLRPAAK